MTLSRSTGELPPWDDDPLSAEFFGQAQFNERVAALNYPKVFELLKAVNAAFVAASSILQTFQLIFPERFKIMGIDTEVATLLKMTQVTFKR